MLKDCQSSIPLLSACGSDEVKVEKLKLRLSEIFKVTGESGFNKSESLWSLVSDATVRSKILVRRQNLVIFEVLDSNFRSKNQFSKVDGKVIANRYFGYNFA